MHIHANHISPFGGNYLGVKYLFRCPTNLYKYFCENHGASEVWDQEDINYKSLKIYVSLRSVAVIGAKSNISVSRANSKREVAFAFREHMNSSLLDQLRVTWAHEDLYFSLEISIR